MIKFVEKWVEVCAVLVLFLQESIRIQKEAEAKKTEIDESKPAGQFITIMHAVYFSLSSSTL